MRIDKAESYVSFDDAGLVEVRCMDCQTVLRTRVLKKVVLVDEQKNFLGYERDQEGNYIVVPRLARTSAYHEQQVQMSDGSFARIPRCESCCQAPLEMKKLSRQIQLAWMEEMTACEKTLTQRKAVLKVCGKLTVTGVCDAREL